MTYQYRNASVPLGLTQSVISMLTTVSKIPEWIAPLWAAYGNHQLTTEVVHDYDCILFTQYFQRSSIILMDCRPYSD